MIPIALVIFPYKLNFHVHTSVNCKASLSIVSFWLPNNGVQRYYVSHTLNTKVRFPFSHCVPSFYMNDFDEKCPHQQQLQKFIRLNAFSSGWVCLCNPYLIDIETETELNLYPNSTHKESMQNVCRFQLKRTKKKKKGKKTNQNTRCNRLHLSLAAKNYGLKAMLALATSAIICVFVYIVSVGATLFHATMQMQCINSILFFLCASVCTSASAFAETFFFFFFSLFRWSSHRRLQYSRPISLRHIFFAGNECGKYAPFV